MASAGQTPAETDVCDAQSHHNHRRRREMNKERQRWMQHDATHPIRTQCAYAGHEGCKSARQQNCQYPQPRLKSQWLGILCGSISKSYPSGHWPYPFWNVVQNVCVVSLEGGVGFAAEVVAPLQPHSPLQALAFLNYCCIWRLTSPSDLMISCSRMSGLDWMNLLGLARRNKPGGHLKNSFPSIPFRHKMNLHNASWNIFHLNKQWIRVKWCVLSCVVVCFYVIL